LTDLAKATPTSAQAKNVTLDNESKFHVFMWTKLVRLSLPFGQLALLDLNAR